MITSLLFEITTYLTAVSDTPALDASVLIGHVVNKPRTWVMAHPELTLTTEQQNHLDHSLARLEHGESFPYVLGHWEFFGLEFEVTPDVLIPRPETELLVEKAIAWLQASPLRRTIADVGTGSGAIAVSIAVNVPNARVLATDVSRKALEVARRNALKFKVEKQIEFVECDLLPTSPADHTRRLSQVKTSSIDLICAYQQSTPTETLQKLPIFGREPTVALDGGSDGLDLIRRLLNIAPAWLAPHGLILLEIEATRGIQALNMACDLFSAGVIHLHQDLAGKDRLLEITF